MWNIRNYRSLWYSLIFKVSISICDDDFFFSIRVSEFKSHIFCLKKMLNRSQSFKLAVFSFKEDLGQSIPANTKFTEVSETWSVRNAFYAKETFTRKECLKGEPFQRTMDSIIEKGMYNRSQLYLQNITNWASYFKL